MAVMLLTVNEIEPQFRVLVNGGDGFQGSGWIWDGCEVKQMMNLFFNVFLYFFHTEFTS